MTIQEMKLSNDTERKEIVRETEMILMNRQNKNRQQEGNLKSKGLVKET